MKKKTPCKIVDHCKRCKKGTSRKLSLGLCAHCWEAMEYRNEIPAPEPPHGFKEMDQGELWSSIKSMIGAAVNGFNASSPVKIYRPGTPEFNAIGGMYAQR